MDSLNQLESTLACPLEYRHACNDALVLITSE
jgi:hypothetical protein